MLRVYLRNTGTSDGQWLLFPLVGQNRKSVLETVNGNTTEIGEAVTSLKGLAGHLKGKALRLEQGIRELEFLDRQTEAMTEKERAVFQGALDIEKPQYLVDIVNLSCSLDKYVLYEGAADYVELGRRMLGRQEIPAGLALYLDYRLAGREYAKEHAGCFTKLGYVTRTGEPLQQPYDGRHLPFPGYDGRCVIQVHLRTPYYTAGHYPFYPVSLPASRERLALAEKRLGVSSLEQCRDVQVYFQPRELGNFLPHCEDVKELNTFATLLADKGILKDAVTRKKLFAALEAEVPENMVQASEIAAGLERYTVLPEEVRTAKDYGVYCMKAESKDISAAGYSAYGEMRMKRDGVVQTEHGWVLRGDIPIGQLAEEMKEIRLFSPLKGYLYPYDEDRAGILDEAEELSPRKLCLYEDMILERLSQEHLEEEGDRGLAVYLRNRLLKRKVYSMNPTVEAWNGRLWGVLEVKSRGDLSPQELSGLIGAWEGQESDGWGEGFEQREIKVREGNVYVSFWNSGSDFFIRTEQELKQESTECLGMQMGGMGDAHGG